MKEIKNNGARLSTIARLVRENVLLIDVGSDHGYLPISLVSSGRIKRAIASDVVPGPLSKAKKNISAAGLEAEIAVVLSDGLDLIEVESPSDIVIAGMGGELISKIIDAKPQVKNADIHLIIQPMTKAEYLRRYLCENGFEIISELLACEGKIYQIISCLYTGRSYALTECELAVGKKSARNEDALFRRFVSGKLSSLKIAAEGKGMAAIDCTEEIKLISALEELLDSESKEC